MKETNDDKRGGVSTRFKTKHNEILEQKQEVELIEVALWPELHSTGRVATARVTQNPNLLDWKLMSNPARKITNKE